MTDIIRPGQLRRWYHTSPAGDGMMIILKQKFHERWITANVDHDLQKEILTVDFISEHTRRIA